MARECYQYQSLQPGQYIRLLYLKKASDEDPIQAHLTTHCLEEEPNYVALSYVWGDEDPDHDLLIGDHVLKIRPNPVQGTLETSKAHDAECVGLCCMHQPGQRRRTYQPGQDDG